MPGEVDDDAAIFVEPLAAAFQILEQIVVRSSERVLVLGDGRLGLLRAQVMALTGAQVTLLGRHLDKLSLVEGRGINVTVDAAALDDRFDIAVDVTGATSGLGLAIDLLRPRGTLVLKNTTDTAGQLDMSPAVVKEVTIVRSRCGPFSPAIDALCRRTVTVSSLISARYPLGQGVAAFRRAGERGALKVLLDMIEPTVPKARSHDMRGARC